MSIKKVWKTGGSYVVALNAHEINHLQLWKGDRIEIKRSRGSKITITRFPAKKQRLLMSLLIDKYG